MGQANLVGMNSINDNVRPVAERQRTAEQLRRLLEIAAELDASSPEQAAKIGSRDVQSLLARLIQFNEEGPDGPVNKSLPGASESAIDKHKLHHAGWYKLFAKLLAAAGGMLDNEKLQLAGPVVVISAMASAEFGAHALAYWPSSPLLWYLSLEVFRPVQYSFGAVNGLAVGDLAQTLCVVIPLLALIGIGLITKVRLPLALASNLSFVYSAALLYGSYLANGPVTKIGVKLSALWGPSFLVLGSVLLASAVSSAISHRAYWREIFSS